MQDSNPPPAAPSPQKSRPPLVVTLASTENGFHVVADGAPYRTPKGEPLRLPTAALALAVAAELQQENRRNRLSAMPLTQLAVTAQDRVADNRAAVIASLLAYVDSELCCYRAEAPAPLQQRQQAVWQPLLDAFAARTGVRLSVTSGVAPVRQPPEARAAVQALLEPMPAMPLAGLAAAVQVCGSLVLGLALADGTLDAEAAYRASLLDELYQAERWGNDAEAEQRRARIAAEITATERFLRLLAAEETSG